MSTFADVVNDVWAYLYSFNVVREKETSLAADITDPTATSIQVADGAQVDRGYIEIDDEIMAVASSDRSSGLVTVHPWGRGRYSTVAATHTAGSRVVANPAFPRSRIKQTVNQIINDIYPTLYGVAKDETNTARVAQITYPVPANAESIISIAVQTKGPSKMWRPVTRWHFDYLPDSTAFPTGKSVDIFEAMPPGKPIKIVYRTRFGTFVNDTDTFAAMSLDEGYRDVIALGTEARLLPALDGPRMLLASIESRSQASADQPGIASQVARQLFLQYQQRLHDEADRLLRQYPATMVRMS